MSGVHHFYILGQEETRLILYMVFTENAIQIRLSLINYYKMNSLYEKFIWLGQARKSVLAYNYTWYQSFNDC